MKKLTLSFLSVSLIAMMPVIAGAAGTYYNGNLYQNPQRYGNNRGGYYNNYGAGQYGQNQSMVVRNTTTRVTKKSSGKQQSDNVSSKQGFHLGAYFTHEFANWDLEMKKAGSKLRYDNLKWNVVSGEGAYYFGGSTPMQIKFGARYGVQYGQTSMMDDDITNGGMWTYVDIPIDTGSGTVNESVLFGAPAVSVGTSKDGTQFGFNAAFGLTDFFKIGRAKITPSIGYRYLKYKLSTQNNVGVMVGVANSETFSNCIENGGEIQCFPYVGFQDETGRLLSIAGISYDESGIPLANYYGSYIRENDTSAAQIDAGDTYYYEQHGTSHKYETEWAGPYIALDMEYDINKDNFVNAGIEFGLPIYNSKGDQPYRVDWRHPTSVEDKGSFGDAYHFGLNAMWSTALTDSIMLSLGMTYDYYKVKDATATTYLDSDYYNSLVNLLETNLASLETTGTPQQIAALQNELTSVTNQVDSYKASGWTIESKSEIESVYSAMGIRIGINVKF